MDHFRTLAPVPALLVPDRGALLLKQLRLRFGDLPAAVVARVEAAEVQELDTWAERFVTASRIEDVFLPG